MFLQPGEVLDDVFGTLGFEGPNQRFARERRAAKETELRRLEQMLRDKQAARELVESSAKSWASASTTASFVAMTAGVGFYAYLTFDYLSWDIMEPVTYFTGEAVVLLAYFWWLATNTEFEYEAMEKTVSRWRKSQMYSGLATAKPELLAAEGNPAQGGDDPESFESVVDTLQQQVDAVKEELDMLDRTRFDPALVSYYEASNPMSLEEVEADLA